MSTRSIIARPTKSGFAGVYHHYDGYPEGLGATLFELFNAHFAKDLDAMLHFLIDEHPAGWSTIIGADFTLPPGFRNAFTGPCAVCGQSHSLHYRQYLGGANGNPLNLPDVPNATPEDFLEIKLGNYSRLGHNWQEIDTPHGPQCYCHGGRHEQANKLTQNIASGCGCEWAYVFSAPATLEVYSAYHRDGNKAIGYFGSGDPNAQWRRCATINLHDPQPDWKAIGLSGTQTQRPVINFA